jgi:hypothetical protein
MVTASRHSRLAFFERLLPFRLLVTLILITGIPFWYPESYRLLGENALGLVHAHVAFGIVLVLAAVWHYRKVGSRPSLKTLLQVSVRRNRPHTGALVTKLIPLCISALLISGIGLVFSRVAPPALGEFFLYVHGAVSLFLIVLLGFAGIGFATKKRPMPQSVDAGENEWHGRITPEAGDLPLTQPAIQNKTESFLRVFGLTLKQSRLRLFLEDYRWAVQCKDVFSDKHAPDAVFTPGDYLISIYMKYFTFSGWIGRSVFSGQGLTDSHIREMCCVFHGYASSAHRKDFDDEIACQEFMAGYGRFILSEMGLVPDNDISGPKE